MTEAQVGQSSVSMKFLLHSVEQGKRHKKDCGYEGDYKTQSVVPRQAEKDGSVIASEAKQSPPNHEKPIVQLNGRLLVSCINPSVPTAGWYRCRGHGVPYETAHVYWAFSPQDCRKAQVRGAAAGSRFRSQARRSRSDPTSTSYQAGSWCTVSPRRRQMASVWVST
jgi:hypothetical protein